MAVGLGDKAARNESSRLASTLRLVGIGNLVLATLTLVLAFTGYETPKAVNIGLFFVGINLLMLGWVCLALGKSFGRASGETAPPALGMALARANTLFGYYLVLIGTPRRRLSRSRDRGSRESGFGGIPSVQ